MPNVQGLDTAPVLFTKHPHGATVGYGPHCTAVIDVTPSPTVTLNRAKDGRVLAVFDVVPGRARAALAQIDGDTVTAVNAFLRDFGKVKAYWRTPEGQNPYRWHPHGGTASAPVKAPKAPKTAPVATPVATPVAAPVAPVAAPATPVAPATAPGITFVPATSAPIETAMVWSDQYTKRPTQKTVTKTFSLVGDVLVPTKDVRVLDSIKAQRDAGKPAHGLITGPRGTAKTKVVTQWAFVNDLPVVIIPGQSIQTADDWFGSTVPTTSPTATAPFEWVWSDAAKLIMTGKPCVIVLDELNRPENERALNGIMGLLDWRGVAKPLGAPHAVTLHVGQIILATLNEGVEYVGTVEIDAAVRDRFSFGGGIRMAYTSVAIEGRILRQQVPGIDATTHGPEVSKRLALIGSAQRAKVVAKDGDESFPSGITLSTRALVGIADKIVTGMEPVEAIWAVARATFQPEDEKGLLALIESQFGSTAVALDDDLADDDDIEKMLDAEGL